MKPARTATLALMLVLGLGQLACWDSADQKKESELENQRLTYLALILTRNSTDHCVQAETAALSCSSSAGLTGTYVTTLQTAYSITNSTQTAAAICAQLPSSPLFSGSSESAKNCHFDCNKAYFERIQSEGRCNSTQYATALTAYTRCLPILWVSTCAANDATLNTCLSNCFKTGTVIP